MSTKEAVMSRPSSNSCGGGGGGSRWCPTPEQVMLLEGMYRGGLRTPTATQIQQITARLSLYGKIQGKNVFYWFQNHKARDRQKLRKRLMAAMYQNQRTPLYPPYYNSSYHHSFSLIQGGPGAGSGGSNSSSSSYKNIVNEWNVDQTACNKKVDICDCSLMTVTMMESSSSTATSHHQYYCTRIPPKTLQLFPTTPKSTS